ncbi:MAG: TIGR04372 family glycosyltransferase [Acidimicrobiaceae bacterium]
MIPKFVRKKFAGVQQPLGRWILRHVAEFIVLSPAILVTWLWLKLRRKKVLIVGIGSSSITAFIMPLEVVLRRRLSAGLSTNSLIVLNLSVDANTQIRRMYDRVTSIYGSESSLRRSIIWWSSKLGGFQLPIIDILETQNDEQWHVSKPIVSLSNEELARGDQFLKSQGVLPGADLVCYATRSSSYYASLSKSGVNVKPQSIRNPDENVYFEVADALAARGSHLFRMGKDLDTTIPPSKKNSIYDYASSFRTDFLDVYLLYRCNYLVNGSTGIVSIRAMFNLPTLNSDFYRLHKNWFKNDVGLFQKVWLVNENRLATVGEMVSMGDSFSDERHQERLGVRLVKNTAEEILAACDEMEARLNGTWVTTEEDEVLQKKYWDLICDSGHHGGRIGAQFLRDNQDLLR